MAQTSKEPGKFELGAAPLFFTGQPPDLDGHLELRNRSREALKAREVAVTNLKLKLPQAARVEFERTLSKIQPGEQGRGRMRLRVSEGTPPGVYGGEIDFEGESRAVTVQVLESWRLEVLPTSLSFKVAAREPLRGTIRVTNIGNMPYTLHRGAEFSWEEKRCAQGSRLAEWARQENGERREGRGGCDEGDILEGALTVQAEERVIQPGQTREVELEIPVPEMLKPGRVYGGCVPFEQARLRLDLEILEGSQER